MVAKGESQRCKQHKGFKCHCQIWRWRRPHDKEGRWPLEQSVALRLTASQETRSSDLWPQRTGFSQQPELAWKQILPQILQVRAELSWHLDASLVKPRTWNPGKPTGMSSPENCETMNGYCFNLLIFGDMLDSNKQNLYPKQAPACLNEWITPILYYSSNSY